MLLCDFYDIFLSFTFMSLVLNAFFSRIFLRSYLIILMIYGTRISLNEKFRTYLKKKFSTDDFTIDFFHYLTHWILPIYFICSRTNKILLLKNPVPELIFGTGLGIVYILLVDVEKIYKLPRRTILTECFFLWLCISLFTISLNKTVF